MHVASVEMAVQGGLTSGHVSNINAIQVMHRLGLRHTVVTLGLTYGRM